MTSSDGRRETRRFPRRVALFVAAALLLSLAVVAAIASTPRAPNAPRVVHDVAVRGDLRADLALPAQADRATPVPWIVFLRERGDDADEHATSFADAMQARGIAVATVAVSADAEAAKSVALLLRELRSRAATYGLADGLSLAGDRRAAPIVARLALDPSVDLDRSSLRGVVTFNGAFGEDDWPALAHVTTTPFLVLSAHGDTPEIAQGSRRFARALERAGAKDVHRHHVSSRDVHTLVNLSTERDDVADLVAAFVQGRPLPGGPDSQWTIDDVWGAHAPLSTDPLRTDATLIEHKTAGPDLRRHITELFADSVGDLEPWPALTYDAIALEAYLAAHPELGHGEWLTLENVRGERLVFSRAELRRRKAEVVVGLDDEPNLFRLFVTYNVYRTYSWRPETGARRLLFRPVGAFLHFPGETRISPTHAEFALTAASFRVTADDPLAKARRRSPRVAEVLTNDQGCLQCHAMDDQGAKGARAHHLRAADGAIAEAFALPLVEYPIDVMRRFLFEQDRVAEDFGVGPLRVDPATATALLAALADDRDHARE